ncbi:hypothetical protein [Legionella rowbothamii]|uniref:hypothetical protein n=1 Tax=Legionella rowbothamii TaxID=96229 RepID=UPI001F5E562E|nr:hypothetical protein [Legionella rowbothamii]
MESAKKNLFKTSMVAILLVLGAPVFAAPPNAGQLVIINGLDNLTTANAHTNSRSNLRVQVYDTHTPTTPCFTAQRLGYYNVATIRWQANGIHSASSCAGTGIGTAAISKVVITPLNKLINNRITIVYDATVDTSVPKATADSIDFTPPTTIYTNMTLVINGSGIPSTVGQTASSTNWGFTVTPIAPVFDMVTGELNATGVPGAVGAYGISAEKQMRHYGIIPFHTAAKNDGLF